MEDSIAIFCDNKILKRKDSDSINEVAILKKLNHPNIVKLEGYYFFDGITYCITPFYDCDLSYYIEKKLRWVAKIDIERKLISAVSYLHGNNILHLDIKPSNILINKTKEVVLCDFENARRSDRGIYTYTVGYRAPELLLGEKCSKKSDIFALGVVFIELESGRKFFKIGEQQALDRRTFYIFVSTTIFFYGNSPLFAKMISMKPKKRPSINYLRKLYNIPRPKKIKFKQKFNGIYNSDSISRHGNWLYKKLSKEMNISFESNIYKVVCGILARYLIFDDTEFPSKYSKYLQRILINLDFDIL